MQAWIVWSMEYFGDKDKKNDVVSVQLRIFAQGWTAARYDEQEVIMFDRLDDILIHYEELMQETVSSEPVCSHADDAHSFVRLNFSLPSLPKEKLEPMMSGCLHRVLRLYQSRRLGASGTDRDFYDYQITMIQRTLSAD